jgi:hypothetical protein
MLSKSSFLAGNKLIHSLAKSTATDHKQLRNYKVRFLPQSIVFFEKKIPGPKFCFVVYPIDQCISTSDVQIKSLFTTFEASNYVLRASGTVMKSGSSLKLNH